MIRPNLGVVPRRPQLQMQLGGGLRHFQKFYSQCHKFCDMWSCDNIDHYLKIEEKKH